MKNPFKRGCDCDDDGSGLAACFVVLIMSFVLLSYIDKFGYGVLIIFAIIAIGVGVKMYLKK